MFEKNSTKTIKNINNKLFEWARIEAIKLNVPVGEVINKALELSKKNNKH